MFVAEDDPTAPGESLIIETIITLALVGHAHFVVRIGGPCRSFPLEFLNLSPETPASLRRTTAGELIQLVESSQRHSAAMRPEIDHTVLKFFHVFEDDLREVQAHGAKPGFLCTAVTVLRMEWVADTQGIESANKVVVDECNKALGTREDLYSARLVNTKAVHAEVPEVANGGLLKTARLNNMILACESEYNSAEYKEVHARRVGRFNAPLAPAALQDVKSTDTLPPLALQDLPRAPALSVDAEAAPALDPGASEPAQDDPNMAMEWAIANSFITVHDA